MKSIQRALIFKVPRHSRESDLFLCIGFVHLKLCILSIHDKMKSCSADSELFHGEENGGGNGGGRFLKFSKVWVRQAKLKK